MKIFHMKIFRVRWLARGVALLLVPSLAWIQCEVPIAFHPTTNCQGKNLVTKLGKRISKNESFSSTKTLIEILGNNAKHLRARIVVGGNALACSWNLTVRDSQYHVIQTLVPDDFREASFRWTTRVAGNLMILDLRPCSNGLVPDIKYDQYIEMPNQATYSYYSSKIRNTLDYVDLYRQPISPENRHLRPLGDYVGFLMSSYEENNWGCSGVMIAPDLFLTNWHCGRPNASPLPLDKTWMTEIWQNTIVDISWDDDLASREYYAVELMAKCMDLDYALLRVQPIITVGVPRFAPLSAGPINKGDKLILVHHPEGKPKQVSTQQCQVLNNNYPSWMGETENVDFTNQCDTESGSSGSPVFNTRGQVVGIHHLGFKYDDNCNPDGYNKAVKIQKILDDIKKQKPSLEIPSHN